MGPIVCATRGGEASLRTQQRAIALAQEKGAELIFLYVIDPSFAGTVDEALTDTLVDELRLLGKCLLRLAQTRARKKGLKAQVAIRQGDVQQSIEAFVGEVGASMLIVGAPQPGTAAETFEPERLNDFAAAIQRATGVEVLVVE
jgi:nucleotide-binding universal stress UspA family protein